MVKKTSEAPQPASRIRRRPSAAADVGSSGGAVADTQHRLLEAQATIERDYARLRELETRYRYLMQSSSDAIVLVDAGTARVFDINPAACARLHVSLEKMIGSPVTAIVHADSAANVQARIEALLGGAGTEAFAATLSDGSAATITPSLFRQDGAPVILVRIDGPHRARGVSTASSSAPFDTRLSDYALVAPDAVVLTDRAGIVLQANASFVELVQVATERQVRGVSLGRWLGRTSVDLGVLISNLRQRGSLKLFSTHLRAEYGSLSEVEISAAQVGDGDSSFLGFTLRDVGRRLPASAAKRDDIAKSVDQMTELVGRVPMKDIVGNTAGLIEQMCIKAALELTRDNRAAAAELLGLSRQSLYVKLRRYDLLEPGAAPEEPEV